MKKRIQRKLEEKTLQSLKRDLRDKFYGQLNPELHKLIFMRDKNRKMDTGLFRLRSGHSRLKHHLFRLGMEEDENCRFCQDNTTESIQHVLLDCPRFYSHQVALKTRLRKENIRINIETILAAKNLNKKQARITAASLKQYLIKTEIIDHL